MRDYRLWWVLFVFFGALSVLTVQHGYRRWRRMQGALSALTGTERTRQARRLREEGWRLACMVMSILAMTTLVLAAVLEAPPRLVIALQVLAVACVLGVVLLGLRQ